MQPDPAVALGLAVDTMVAAADAESLDDLFLGKYPPLVPLWSPDELRIQTIRSGFRCFCGAAVSGLLQADLRRKGCYDWSLDGAPGATTRRRTD